ncbi:MAG TPA: ribosome maturation factor RimM [Egibacteraceae bacterium]|nr:ribosome maturation factor RimM [Egibacteraceae bacterium]
MSAEVAVGVVGKPLGLRGEVYVQPDPDVGEQFPPGATYTAGDRTLTVAASRMHGNRRVVRFAGVEDREQAEAMRGAVLTLDRADVALDEDAFWTDDVVGREVVTVAGEPVGTLADVTDGAAHDYLVISRPDGRELLVPAVDELVEVTPDHIVIRPLPGLLDGEG